MTRKPAPAPIKEITYVVADANGKNPKSVLLKGISAQDPLKNVRHFRALLVEGAGAVIEVKAVLLDMDWVMAKK